MQKAKQFISFYFILLFDNASSKQLKPNYGDQQSPRRVSFPFQEKEKVQENATDGSFIML